MLLMLDEAKRLYDLGFAVHWIKQGSKAPVKRGWSSGTKDDWEEIKNSYVLGYGLGVRMGEPSKLPDGTYLANIDVDIKSTRESDKKEALAFLKKHFSGLDLSTTPMVQTGYGFRLFIRTPFPVKSKKIGSSKATTVAFMPTTEINRKQREYQTRGLITEKELMKGFRVRSAWEVEIMSIGKQVVLPPSIHPETGGEYIWKKRLNAVSDMLLLEHSVAAEIPETISDTDHIEKASGKFKFVDVDLSKLSAKYRAALVSGDGVDDRSSWCFSVAIVMLRQGYNTDEVVSALTDRTNYLGQVGFDHRDTNDRGRAADWVYNYCVKKALDEMNAGAAFENVPDLNEFSGPDPLSPAEADAQLYELMPELRDWKSYLLYGPKGKLLPTMNNVILILENALNPQLVKFDSFSKRLAIGHLTKWMVKDDLNRLIEEKDAINIKQWLASTYGLDVPTGTIYEATIYIGNKNQYHPVKDWFKTLPDWDGVPRLYTWLKRYFRAEDDKDYLGEVFSKWMYASVTRVFEPGAKFDWMPIFEGKQGIGKSMFGSILFGQQFFLDWLPKLADKDASGALQGILCVEFGELVSLNRNEVETIKSYVSRQVDKYRPPYGRGTIEYYRQCIFYGTTNASTYLHDETGNRRFMPVKVGQLNFDQLYKDREQLWAEAIWTYQNGLVDSLYLSPRVNLIAEGIRAGKKVDKIDHYYFGKWAEWAEKNMELILKDGVRITDLDAAGGAFQSDVLTTPKMKIIADVIRQWGSENGIAVEKRHTKKGNKWVFIKDR